MKAYIILHQENLSSEPSVNTIGAYYNYKNALAFFNAYLDNTEQEWRNATDSEDKDKPPPMVFNRFAEQTGSIITYASCPGHYVYIEEIDIE
mgnify:CR=1 FL=1